MMSGPRQCQTRESALAFLERASVTASESESARLPRWFPVALFVGRIRLVLLAIVVFIPLLSAARVHAAFPAQSPSREPWLTQAGQRYRELTVAPGGRPGFTLMPSQSTGVLFTNVLTIERGLTNQIFMSGSGVACGDVDGDGLVDLYFCGLDAPNRLYRNLGAWRFEDVTAAAGVACPEGASTGAVLADVDGDGDLDLLVAGLGRGVRFFRNEGQGRFVEVTDAAGLRSQSGAMSMALADIDGDGDLDLYVANYRASTFQDEPGVRFRVVTTNGVRRISMIEGRPPTAAELIRYSVSAAGNMIVENGEADVLYRNDGHGHFTPVSWTDGTFLDEAGHPLSAPPYDWGYSAMFRDMNGDGAPDLYVCNDNESPDRCWINDGTGRFRALGTAAWRQTSLSSMGVDFADLNRDGFDEFFVADMLGRERGTRHRQMIDRRPPLPPGLTTNRPAYQKNTLFLNRGDGTYAEMAQLAGVDATDWTWSAVFLDVDLDGFEDLLVTTGLERSLRDADARRELEREKAQRRLGVREFQELRRTMPRLETPNRAFRNRGDLTFEEQTANWGFDSTLVSQGMALADLDGDGDLDVVVNVLNGPALLYRNNSSAPRLAVRLRGREANRAGIGARVQVLGGPMPQSQEMIAGGRYLSCDDAMRTFAAASVTQDLRIEVTWRSGRRSNVTAAHGNRIYEISEDGAMEGLPRIASTQLKSANAARWFGDVSERLNHRHFETPFNDAERQSLLSRRLGQLGPGVAWGDLNQDGIDDLIIGSGRGGRPAVFLGTDGGSFRRIDVSDVLAPSTGDLTSILVAPTRNGLSTRLIIGQSSYESGSANEPAVMQIEAGATGIVVKDGVPGDSSSVGPMAMADIDGDGFLDLFLGGRLIPGRYPEAASSRILRGSPEGFVPMREVAAVLHDAGLVSGAMFSDIDGDGRPELVLACDWGAPKIFRNRGGQLEPWDPPVRSRGATASLTTLSRWTGWWNSVTAADFDGDGRLDLVLGNWGRNTKGQSHLDHPLTVYFGDPRGDGRLEGFEAYFDRSLNQYAPWRYWDTVAAVMPAMLERLPSATAYSQAGINRVLGDHQADFRQVTAAVLDSIVLLNRGEYFEATSLPLVVQLSPAFGLCVADFDGDGREDLFVAQNFFDVDSETSRYDAGRGLLLRGDGKGGFSAVPAAQSGLEILGEQRGAAVADFDRDGRPDLVVTQNGTATRLFRNESGRPGVRVRLEGSANNRNGIGASLQWMNGQRVGPVREVRAGGGYWSQDSAVQILSRPWAEGDSKLLVRWPSGGRTTNAIPEGASEVSIDSNGVVRKIR